MPRKINIKKLHKDAIIPFYATEGSCGMDVTATSKQVVDSGKDYGYIEYGIGLAIDLPEGYGAFLMPRSSISKTGLILANSVGLADSDYTGEYKFRFKHIANSKDYNIGDKIGQLVILPIPKIEFIEVNEIKETERGEGGFGSTDTK